MKRSSTYYDSLVILLTGTITPNSKTTLSVKDPKIRLTQYMEALQFYIEKTKSRIVFVENSGTDFNVFPKITDRIEYLSFKSPPEKIERGKGFKELQIIEYALNNSEFIKNADAIIKITGRLKVLNINQIIIQFLRLRSKSKNLVYADPFAFGNMDARCFVFTLDFWTFLKDAGVNINVHHNFELTLWDAISNYIEKDQHKFKAIKVPLRIQGVSGSFGNEYDHNLFVHYARYIRKITEGFFNSKNLEKSITKRNS
ncbi:hypothetical protein C8P64_0047 [Christiangramia gaetbulicola]|uniref:Uncharacterized protein n=1 Tax=Christiangramia gaetbulicola TaxID=703340 RepID=A0A2T6AJV8_9FLAO|nr:hypothetical protein [Christiangramia gaetbulicola]PTX44077.1 hypothetical protein C8P64_0047 [Christiangramia gaetbulicola]